MSYQTVDHMAGGNRVMIGLGASHPEYAEGFHGIPWGKPVQRMREFVAVCRAVGRGEPVDVPGSTYSIPYRGPENKGITAKAPLLVPNPNLPIYIAAFGPQTVALAAEIADGFFPTSFRPGMLKPRTGPPSRRGLLGPAAARAMATSRSGRTSISWSRTTCAPR
jgi:alkanesulfonate monooxygenase SsuD/methylene tetrahydromethanopterin reductase-like flavin-dependent oxidoreductase (luciferase family)